MIEFPEYVKEFASYTKYSCNEEHENYVVKYIDSEDKEEIYYFLIEHVCCVSDIFLSKEADEYHAGQFKSSNIEAVMGYLLGYIRGKQDLQNDNDIKEYIGECYKRERGYY